MFGSSFFPHLPPASLVAGHPRVFKAAVFDIISTDVANSCPVSIAESIIIMIECLDSFPNLSQHYEIHISHSKGNASCCGAVLTLTAVKLSNWL